MRLTLKVKRLNPQTDQRSYYQDFTVTVEDNAKVLDALLEARTTDPSLSFRRSCRSAICGSCAVAINGKPGLACHTLITDVINASGGVTIDPLPGFRPLKDLVVDLDPFFDSLRAVIPWLIPKERHDGLMSPQDTSAVESPATCVLCGACDSAMELPGEVHPAAAVKAWRLALDPRDRLGRARAKLIDSPVDVLRLFVRDLPEQCPKGIRVSEELLEGADREG
jgi:succinate dehydrogenase / fumarate reductase iron-sulfur subunit